MTDPLLSDPFNRWWAERRYRSTSGAPPGVRSTAREAWDAARGAAATRGYSGGPLIDEGESRALTLAARVLAEVAEGLMRSGHPELADESVRSADALDRLRRRTTVDGARDGSAQPQAER